MSLPVNKAFDKNKVNMIMNTGFLCFPHYVNIFLGSLSMFYCQN